MKVLIKQTKEDASLALAEQIIEQVKQQPTSRLGLATGSSPEEAYELVAKEYLKNNTDWSQISSFNLDEYVGLDPLHPESYHSFMKEHLFSKVNIKEDNTHFPNDPAFAENPELYDAFIDTAGGIDLQILGIGTNGHIAFNEPGTAFDSKTRVVTLAASTREDNSRFFDSLDDVPKKAVTMGISSIMNAKKIVLIATKETKQDVIKELIQGKMDENCPATVLQKHKDVTIILDEAAAKKLR